ncbi:MAG: 50S ribosomal protein L30 [Candidatus Aenigmarchaeota archaeon]|nr:50S ribosomal protein L30 [Candidatus Aenigmarchaeota archaeon]
MLSVVRIRGTADLSNEVRDTLKSLGLNAPNHCALVPEMPAYKGMLDKVKDVVTYGEIEKKMLVEMLKKRLRMTDDKKVNESTLKTVTKFNSYDEFADMLIQGKAMLSDFKKLQPIFRLTPPSKGFRSIREHYPKGDLGYRGTAINSLLKRMI